MTQNQIWQHMTSGERYCVTVEPDGAVYGVAGPLHYSEISLADLADYETERADAEWMGEHASEFRALSDAEIATIEREAREMRGNLD